MLFAPPEFSSTRKLRVIQTSQLPPERPIAFDSTNLIEGVELLSLVAFVMEQKEILAGRSVVEFVDNNCALCAAIKASSRSDVISHLAQLFGDTVQRNDIKIWLERVPSARNIADLPTREVKIPSVALEYRSFTQLNIVPRLLTKLMGQTK